MSEEQKENLGDEFKESAKEFADSAAETANEFRERWNETTHNGENKKVLAGILAILIGSLGIHKFILGYNKEGIIQIVISVISCGIAGIIPLVEGIIYLTKSDDEFYQTYQVNKRPWF